MPDENFGVIIGVIKRDKTRHYRRELKSGDPSANSLCGVKGDWLGDAKNNDEIERRMEMPICPDCEAAASL